MPKSRSTSMTSSAPFSRSCVLICNKEGVRVETQLDGALPAVVGDPVQLQQVILNLVVNAMDAMRIVQQRVLKHSIQPELCPGWSICRSRTAE